MEPSPITSKAVLLHDEIVLMTSLASRASLPGARSVDPLLRRSRTSRIARILDALAQVTVTDREVIAVAVAPPAADRTHTTLHFAGNEPIPQETQDYLRHLLPLLRRLANTHRLDNDSPQKDAGAESPQVKTCIILRQLKTDLRNQIQSLIIMHTLPKLTFRLEKNRKYYNDIKASVEAEPLLACDSALMEFINLANLVYEILEIRDFLTMMKTNSEFQGLFVTSILGMAMAYRSTTSERLLYPLLSKFLEGFAYTDSRPSQPEDKVERGLDDMQNHKTRAHVLNKITLLPRAIISLITWAMSRRLRTNFEEEIHLQFYGGIPTLPLSGESSTNAAETLIGLAKLSNDKALREFIARQMGFLTSQLRPNLHAECLLVQELSAQRAKTPALRVCSHIGVSKLSCFGCIKWMNIFNTHHGSDWSTSGTHDKLCAWGFLEAGDKVTGDVLVVLKQVHTRVREAFSARCRLRFGHDRESFSAISSVDIAEPSYVGEDINLDDVDAYIDALCTTSDV